MPAFDRDTADHTPPGADADASTPTTVEPVASDELDSRKLFAASRRRVIVHQGERYCLQVTRAGKLLLTK